MTLASQAKYRPVLTADQISHICTLARKDGSRVSLEILAVLSSFEFRIRAGAINPAYTEIPKQSLADSLGFPVSEGRTLIVESPRSGDVESPKLSLAKDGTLIKEVSPSVEGLYETWLNDPSLLSVEEIKRVQFYRYYNGKMTPDQERTYEMENLS